MKMNKSLIALTAALALNTAALAGLHAAMTDGAQRAQVAQIEAPRIMVSAKKMATEVAKAKGAGSRS